MKNELRKALRYTAKNASSTQLRKEFKIARAIGAEYRAVEFKNIKASVYLMEKTITSRRTKAPVERFYARAFLDGNFKLSHEFFYAFPSLEARENKIKEWVQEQEERNKKKQASKDTAPHSLQVGDILHGSWGYDQTNLEWIEVIQLVGKTMVELRELKTVRDHSGDMTGTEAPLAGTYTDEAPIRRKVLRGNTIKLHSSCYIRPAEHKEVAGTKVYTAQRWSSYA